MHLLQLNQSDNSIVLSVNDEFMIEGCRKWLSGGLKSLVLSVLREVTVRHMGYHRLHVTESFFPNVPNFTLLHILFLVCMLLTLHPVCGFVSTWMYSVTAVTTIVVTTHRRNEYCL